MADSDSGTFDPGRTDAITERLGGTNIDLVSMPTVDLAPREEIEEIRRDLSRSFPRERAGQTLRVRMDWSTVLRAWSIQEAQLRTAEVAWVDYTDIVAEALSAAGHRVATGRRRDERRRSIRLFTGVSVHVRFDDGAELNARTTSISRHGATVLIPHPLEKDSKVRLSSPACPDPQPFRVAWCSSAKDRGYKAGLEMLGERADFWGTAYGPGAAAAT